MQGQSVLDVDTAGMYRPVTRETRDAFDSLLAFIREQYDDQPYDVLRGAAEEVLAVLKNEGIKVRTEILWARMLLQCASVKVRVPTSSNICTICFAPGHAHSRALSGIF